MTFWFQLGITILQSTLAELHINPASAAPLKNVLVNLANGIYAVYGMTPPAPPATS